MAACTQAHWPPQLRHLGLNLFLAAAVEALNEGRLLCLNRGQLLESKNKTWGLDAFDVSPHSH